MDKNSGLFVSVEELIKDTRMDGRPHVVILGAGASRQVFPYGDTNGNQLPVMSNLVETVGLCAILDRYGIDYRDKDFEEIYSVLYEDSGYDSLIEEIHISVRQYFSKLALPQHPTLYDHLVLSLRAKDVIATFNWDPLLYYACWRNHQRAKLPHVLYLHGNVAIGYCDRDNKKGWINSQCSKCGDKYKPSRLLYPIKRKGYSQDTFVQKEWGTLKDALSRAYVLTIFGYSAPQSDVEAIELMKGGWGNKYKRDIEQIEIIDTKEKQELRNTWNDFIHPDHYCVEDDFYKSSIALSPRRTCEAWWNCLMPEKLEFYPNNPIPRELAFKELWEWFRPLIEAENSKA